MSDPFSDENCQEDLERSSPNLGPYTTKGTLKEPPLRDLLFGSSRYRDPFPHSLLRARQKTRSPTTGVGTGGHEMRLRV